MLKKTLIALLLSCAMCSASASFASIPLRLLSKAEKAKMTEFQVKLKVVKITYQLHEKTKGLETRITARVVAVKTLKKGLKYGIKKNQLIRFRRFCSTAKPVPMRRPPLHRSNRCGIAGPRFPSPVKTSLGQHFSMPMMRYNKASKQEFYAMVPDATPSFRILVGTIIAPKK